MITGLIAAFATSMAAAAEAPAAPQPTAPVATPSVVQVARAAAHNKGDQIICRSMIATGSRLGAERVCKTRDEWAHVNQDAKEMIWGAQLNADRMQPGGG
jgi:hypothetical protein